MDTMPKPRPRRKLKAILEDPAYVDPPPPAPTEETDQESDDGRIHAIRDLDNINDDIDDEDLIVDNLDDEELGVEPTPQEEALPDKQRETRTKRPRKERRDYGSRPHTTTVPSGLSNFLDNLTVE